MSTNMSVSSKTTSVCWLIADGYDRGERARGGRDGAAPATRVPCGLASCLLALYCIVDDLLDRNQIDYAVRKLDAGSNSDESVMGALQCRDEHSELKGRWNRFSRISISDLHGGGAANVSIS